MSLTYLYSYFFYSALTEKMQDNFITILQGYEKKYQRYFLDVFCPKLGLKSCEEKEDLRLLALLLDAMERKGADFTQTFRYNQN